MQVVQTSVVRFDGLEGLRALMACWVVVGHVGNFLGYYLGVNAPAWMKLALLTSVPVNVFIALSGFVVFEMLRKKSAGYSRYLRLRAARIFPIYIFALVLAISLASFRVEVFAMQPWRSPAEIAAFTQRVAEINSSYWVHFIAHLFLAHGLVPETVLPHASQALLAPAWSLSLEWQFYLLAPLIFYLLVRRWWGVVAVAIAFAALQVCAQTLFPGLTNAAIVNSWGYFFLGWFSSLLLASADGSSRNRARMISAFCALPIALGATLMVDSDVRVGVLSLLIWMAAFFGCCRPASKLAVVGTVQRAVSTLLSFPWLRKIGESSYSLYLLHVLVLDAVGWALMRNGLLDGGEVNKFLLLMVTVLPLSLLAAAAGYRFIEKPFMALGRNAVRHAQGN